MNEELLYRYFKVETTSKENEQILEWLDADPVKHQQELEAAQYLYFTLEGANPASRAKPSRILSLRKALTYFASAAAVAALMVGANYIGKQETYIKFTSRMATLEVPNGQRMQITLEDGSKVWLNAGTRLEYPVVFGRGERRVKLSGEAMFAVEHEKSRPFIVETFASEVEVLGTKFNVMADEASSKFSTALLEGSVKIIANCDHETLILAPNEVVNLVNGRLVKDVINDPMAMKWPEGIISLKGLTFLELMSKFEKAYGVKILIRLKIMPTLDIQRGKIRVSDGIDHALRVVQLATDFEFSRNDENNTIVIE